MLDDLAKTVRSWWNGSSVLHRCSIMGLVANAISPERPRRTAGLYTASGRSARCLLYGVPLIMNPDHCAD